jgi:hypothetical protein
VGLSSVAGYGAFADEVIAKDDFIMGKVWNGMADGRI